MSSKEETKEEKKRRRERERAIVSRAGRSQEDTAFRK